MPTDREGDPDVFRGVLPKDVAEFGVRLSWPPSGGWQLDVFVRRARGFALLESYRAAGRPVTRDEVEQVTNQVGSLLVRDLEQRTGVQLHLPSD